MLELDTRGLLCPLPVLKLRKSLKALNTGDSVRLISTDPAAQIDVPHFCQENGYELVSSDIDGDILTFIVREGRDRKG